jgi:hypothetical protein
MLYYGGGYPGMYWPPVPPPPPVLPPPLEDVADLEVEIPLVIATSRERALTVVAEAGIHRLTVAARVTVPLVEHVGAVEVPMRVPITTRVERTS